MGLLSDLLAAVWTVIMVVITAESKGERFGWNNWTPLKGNTWYACWGGGQTLSGDFINAVIIAETAGVIVATLFSIVTVIFKRWKEIRDLKVEENNKDAEKATAPFANETPQEQYRNRKIINKTLKPFVAQKRALDKADLKYGRFRNGIFVILFLFYGGSIGLNVIAFGQLSIGRGTASTRCYGDPVVTATATVTATSTDTVTATAIEALIAIDVPFATSTTVSTATPTNFSVPISKEDYVTVFGLLMANTLFSADKLASLFKEWFYENAPYAGKMAWDCLI
jgi:hypothetical protein